MAATTGGEAHALQSWRAGCAILLLIGADVASAHDPLTVRFRNIGREDGLSQSFVYSIAQDTDGFMWIGTQDGLNRFDGLEFRIFAHDPEDPGSLSDESVRSLLVDRAGVLWVGTDMGGLSRYDRTTGKFANFLHDPSDPSSIASNRVRVLYEDSQGRLWVGTDGAGLDQFDHASASFRHFPHVPGDPSSLSDGHVWDIVEDNTGTIWVGTGNGLNRLEARASSFTRFGHDADDPASISGNGIRALREDRDGRLWIGTDQSGLNRYDPATGTFARFRHDPDDVTSISADHINTLFLDDLGVLWIGTTDGLNTWAGHGHGFNRYNHHASDRYSLPHDNIHAIAQDRSRILWIGSYNGLSLWDPATRAMRHFRHDPDDERSLSENTVTSFAENVDGRIWVGTFSGGLNLFDPGTDAFEHYRHSPDDDNSLSSDRIMSLHVDRRGVLWAGTRARGLNRYDSQTGRYTRFRHDPDDPSSLGADGITAILEDADGGLWIGTFGGGLDYLEQDTGRFRHYRNDPGNPASLSSDQVLVLYEDAEKIIWIGTLGGGLNRFDRASGRFSHFHAEPGRADGLSGDVIFMIQEDPWRGLWLGIKGSGLDYWRPADRQQGKPDFLRVSELDGLPSSSIYAGLWDAAGNLWLSTARGLSRLDVGTLAIRNYGARHGVQGDEFNLAAGFRSSDGTLYFGGMNGFNAFQPRAVVATRPAPQVAIRDFHVFGERSDTEWTVPPRDRVELRHTSNDVTIGYVALEFLAPEQSRYQYRLEGLHDARIDAGNRRQVTFANLPAGEYEFRVRAANESSTWSEQDAVLRFGILPAPWATWWAYSAYFLVTAGAALATGHAYSQRKERAARLENADRLELAEARLREAQRIAALGNWVWDIETNELWWSDEIYRLFQTNRRDFGATYEAFLEHVHPEDRKKVDRAVQRALHAGHSYSIDHRIVRSDGSERIVHERAVVTFGDDGKALRMAGTVHDVTERKQAEEEIRRRAEFQALLARLSSALIQAQPRKLAAPMNRELEAIGRHYGLGAVSVWCLADDRESVRIEYRWRRRTHGFPRDVVRLEEVPGLTDRLRAGEAVIVADVGNMRGHGAADVAIFEEQGIRSFLAIPLQIDGNFLGAMLFLSFDRRIDWPPTIVSELKLIAANIGGALGRAQAVAELARLRDELQAENLELRQEVRVTAGIGGIVGADKALKECLRAVVLAAPTNVPVLVLGETGTGKELIARALHEMSPRRDRSMICVNCPALPADIIESELFGHEAGAFTGAHTRRIGRFELADKSTLFLDEIGELPLELQSKLLRVLQTGEFERLGGTDTLETDVRLIAATNRDLEAEVTAGRFRADLYYRIGRFPIRLPPLRARKGDVPMLAEHFVHKHAARFGKEITAISSRMIRDLFAYDWPGNVRELESTIERALISSTGSAVLDLAAPLGGDTIAAAADTGAGTDLTTIERAHIIKVLERTRWKIAGKGGAASALGVPSSTLRSKMKRLGISRRQPS